MYASSGIGQFKRRCADPFTCRAGRLVVDPPVSYGTVALPTAYHGCHLCAQRNTLVVLRRILAENQWVWGVFLVESQELLFIF